MSPQWNMQRRNGICQRAQVVAVQPVYFDYWAGRGVDVRPLFRVFDGPHIPAPAGPGFAAGYRTSTRCSWAEPRSRPTLADAKWAAKSAAAR